MAFGSVVAHMISHCVDLNSSSIRNVLLNDSMFFCYVHKKWDFIIVIFFALNYQLKKYWLKCEGKCVPPWVMKKKFKYSPFAAKIKNKLKFKDIVHKISNLFRKKCLYNAYDFTKSICFVEKKCTHDQDILYNSFRKKMRSSFVLSGAEINYKY